MFEIVGTSRSWAGQGYALVAIRNGPIQILVDHFRNGSRDNRYPMGKFKNQTEGDNVGPLGTGVLFQKVTDEQAEEDEQ